MMEQLRELEAILFASGEPVHEEKLMQVLGVEEEQLHRMITVLSDEYDAEQRGMMVVRLGKRYQMVSRPKYAESIRRVLEVRRPPTLSAAALEVLSIVAYRQPVTRAYIEQLRGVDSSNTVLTLLDKGLIEACGRLDVPGRPMIYQTTTDFLRTFSISSLEELPELPELEELERRQIGENAEGAEQTCL
jgi:segregation and condensation protein B